MSERPQFRTTHLRKEPQFTNILCSIIKQMAGVREDDNPWAFFGDNLTG
jgi:hypothetical protein